MPDRKPRILLATDLTERCDRARRRALLLAEQLDGEIVAAHVLEGRVGKHAEARIMALKTLIENQFVDTGRLAKALVLRGSPPQALARAADSAGCDIVLTGIARFNSIKDHVLGTTVDYLVRHARMPVLVVKTEPAGDYDKLLVATDLSACSREALDTALALFPKADVSLIHVFHPAFEGLIRSEQMAEDARREAEEGVAAFLEESALPPALRDRVRAKAIAGELPTAIEREINRDPPDLVVLGTHGKSGFVHATIGSRSAELLSWLPHDVLMVREAPAS